MEPVTVRLHVTKSISKSEDITLSSHTPHLNGLNYLSHLSQEGIFEILTNRRGRRLRDHQQFKEQGRRYWGNKIQVETAAPKRSG